MLNFLKYKYNNEVRTDWEAGRDTMYVGLLLIVRLHGNASHETFQRNSR
jgi:hypothetical protein